jgi:uncharacterized protein
MHSGRKIAFLAILIFTLVSWLGAESPSELKPTGYVNDFAHVLDASTVAQLDDLAQQIDAKAHAQIAVVTINSLAGSDIESYAVDLYKKWGIGSKSTDRGVLILLAPNDHKYRIEVGYGLEAILPDGKVGGFGREAVPLLRQNNPNAAVLLLAERVADVIAEDSGVQLTGPRPEVHARDRGESKQKISLGSVIIFLVVGLIVLLTPLRSLLFWLLLSGGGGGWGGGGFGGGGGGGGGGFGGFGGGSSGGGGASGSW